MSCSRRGAAAVALNGQIWVLGGWDGQAYLKAVEVYDTSTGRWSQVKSMLEPRCYAAAAVMDGKIYVAGGYYGQVVTCHDLSLVSHLSLGGYLGQLRVCSVDSGGWEQWLSRAHVCTDLVAWC